MLINKIKVDIYKKVYYAKGYEKSLNCGSKYLLKSKELNTYYYKQ